MSALLQVELSPWSHFLAASIVVLATVTTIILAAGLLSGCAGARRPAARHTIWFATVISVAVCLLMPLAQVGTDLVTGWLAERPPAVAPATTTARAKADGVPPAAKVATMPADPVILWGATAEIESATQGAGYGDEHQPRVHLITLSQQVQVLLMGLWILGMCAMAIRFARDVGAVSRICRQATLANPAQRGAVARYFKGSPSPEILVIQANHSPFVAGLLHPRLFLPAVLFERSSFAIQAIVVHELEHLRRYHIVAGLLQRLLECLLWFHPLVHWMGRQFTFVCEEVCDNAVVQQGSPRSDYVSMLLNLAECFRKATPARCGLLFAGRFERRMQGLLDERRDLSARSRRLTTIVVTAALVLTAILTAVPAAALAQVVTFGSQIEGSHRVTDNDESVDFRISLLPREVAGLVAVKGPAGIFRDDIFDLSRFLEEFAPRGADTHPSFYQLAGELQGAILFGWLMPLDATLTPFVVFEPGHQGNQRYLEKLKRTPENPFRSLGKLTDGRCVATTNPESLRLLMAPSRRLGDDSGYQTVASATSHPRDRNPRRVDLFWFRDARELAKYDDGLKYPPRDRRDMSRFLDGVVDLARAVGGTVTLEDGVLEHRTKIFAPDLVHRQRLFGDLASAIQLTVLPHDPMPAWVPANASHCGLVSMDLLATYENLGGAVDLLAGEQSFFDDLDQSLKHDPNGPQLDVAREIMALLFPLVVTLELIGERSGGTVVAIEVRDVDKLKAGLQKVFRDDPHARSVLIAGKNAWRLRSESQQQWVGLADGQLFFTDSANALQALYSPRSKIPRLRGSTVYQDLVGRLNDLCGARKDCARFFVKGHVQDLLPPFRMVTTDADWRSTLFGKLAPKAFVGRPGGGEQTDGSAALSISQQDNGWLLQGIAVTK